MVFIYLMKISQYLTRKNMILLILIKILFLVAQGLFEHIFIFSFSFKKYVYMILILQKKISKCKIGIRVLKI